MEQKALISNSIAETVYDEVRSFLGAIKADKKIIHNEKGQAFLFLSVHAESGERTVEASEHGFQRNRGRVRQFLLYKSYGFFRENMLE